MTPAEIFAAMIALLGEPSRWTQGAPARLANGVNCTSVHPEAVCWCVLGALTKCASQGGYLGGYRVARELLVEGTLGAPAEYNDTHSHTEVIAMLRGCEQRALAEQAD